MTTTPPAPRWDTRVLDTPLVLDLPARLSAHPDRLTRTAVAAMAAQAEGHPDAPALVACLGHAGVVAVRTPTGTFEVRELRDGWLLVTSPGDPDPLDLAIAAHLRARGLAHERTRPPHPPGSTR
jgi:hypothetical protein